jgi:hypothetical protein
VWSNKVDDPGNVGTVASTEPKNIVVSSGNVGTALGTASLSPHLDFLATEGIAGGGGLVVRICGGSGETVSDPGLQPGSRPNGCVFGAAFVGGAPDDDEEDEVTATVCGITTAGAEAGFFIVDDEGAPPEKAGTCGLTTAGMDFPGLLLAAAS